MAVGPVNSVSTAPSLPSRVVDVVTSTRTLLVGGVAAVAVLAAGCANVRESPTTDYRLIESYLSEAEIPDLSIASETRADGFSRAQFFREPNPDTSCGVDGMSFRLPAGFVRGERVGSGACPESLNGPGIYRGIFMDKSCRLTTLVSEVESGSWSVIVTAFCEDE